MPAARFDAMLFAAGLGTRLGPLTDRIPKALVLVAGVPILERVARRVIEAGADRIVINVHHHADQIETFVAERAGFGVETLISVEPDRPLDTGGGLKQAARLFRGDCPILLHNTDVITDFPLPAMLAAHDRGDAIATLAVNGREASRSLLFDDAGLCGHVDRAGRQRWARQAESKVQALAFCGVHVVSPAVPARLGGTGAFSIIDAYLDLCRQGEKIEPHVIDGHLWLDIGTPRRLADAEDTLAGRN